VQLNCKNSAKKALKIATLRCKIEFFFWGRPLLQWGGGHPLPIPNLLGAYGASILAPSAIDLGVSGASS